MRPTSMVEAREQSLSRLPKHAHQVVTVRIPVHQGDVCAPAHDQTVVASYSPASVHKKMRVARSRDVGGAIKLGPWAALR